MIVLADGLTSDTGPAKIILEALLRGLIMFWLPLALVFAVPVLWIVVGILARIFRYRRLARSGIKDIDRFGGKTFEQYLEVLFKRLGYKVERTKFTGDYGGDLVLRKDGIRTVVQAKRYSKSVGVRAVQEVVAARGYYDCDEMLVVSNSTYTKQARELAEKNNVTLWDRETLIEHLTSADVKQQLPLAATHEAPVAPAATPPKPHRVPGAEPQLATVATCRRCARVLSSGERGYCESNAKRFGGQMLCFRHQRTRRTNQRT